MSIVDNFSHQSSSRSAAASAVIWRGNIYPANALQCAVSNMTIRKLCMYNAN